MPQPVRLIQSVERSLMILDALSRASEIGYSLGEISKEVGINASTTHHLLCTLGYYQVVEQDPVSKRYRLGIHLVELGNSAMASTSLARLARRYVIRLWEYTGQSCSLLVFHGLMRSQILGTSSQQMLSANRLPWRYLACIPPARVNCYWLSFQNRSSRITCAIPAWSVLQPRRLRNLTI